MANLIGNKGDMLAQDRRDMTPSRRKFIQEHRSKADSRGSLPYDFGLFKPKIGHKRKDIEYVCECGQLLLASVNTYGIVCPNCKQFVVVK